MELVDEQLIFQTIEQQRAMVDVAMAKTREARRMGERRDRALSGNMAEREFYQVEEIDAEDCDDAKILDLPYYEVEEWS